MTLTNQNILDDFYEGNHKKISVTVYEDDEKSQQKDITGAEVTYAIIDNDGNILLTKSTKRNEITITGTNVFLVELLPEDTIGLAGTHEHQATVVDSLGDKETVFSGRIRIYKSYSLGLQDDIVTAYLEGG